MIPIYTHVVKIEGLGNDQTDSDRESFATVKYSSLRVNIQPASQETTVITEGAFGKTFTMFAPITASGVIQGDRVTVISGTNIGDNYVINGLGNWNMGGPLPHYEYVLFKSNE